MKKLCNGCGKVKSYREFHKRLGRPIGVVSHCRACVAAKDKIYNKLNRKKKRKQVKARRAYNRLRNHNMRLDYFKSHPCCDCGESDPVVLTFDHVRGTKHRDVTDMMADCVWESILKEIAKCEVRCFNCHMRKTAKQLGYYKYKLV